MALLYFASLSLQFFWQHLKSLFILDLIGITSGVPKRHLSRFFQGFSSRSSKIVSHNLYINCTSYSLWAIWASGFLYYF